MSNRALIEDYGLIGDCESGALVSRHGSIDWLCLPRFDSDACFASLLGDRDKGHWTIAPADGDYSTTRRYHENTLVLETEFHCAGGKFSVIDFMPVRDATPNLFRIIRGIEGKVTVDFNLCLRMDYGSVWPWVRKEGPEIHAVAGPNAFRLTNAADLQCSNQRIHGSLEIAKGDRRAFDLSWYPSHQEAPAQLDPDEMLNKTTDSWREWVAKCTRWDEYREPVVRSLITLKALTCRPTGGTVAALTTSLPEDMGGCRNWDYRYCWIRDATFTLYALLDAGYTQEATDWRNWLVRALAARPDRLQPIYGIEGERRLVEWEADWLSGFADSRPVRIGNKAASQLQIDSFGEIMDALHLARRKGMVADGRSWEVQRDLVNYLSQIWREPDAGIWEMRSHAQQFTHSKVMAWVAVDRAVQCVEQFNLPGDAKRWRELAREIKQDVCLRGFNEKLGTFTQSYESDALDAANLMIPLVGFLPVDDPRVQGTIAAIESGLMRDGLVYRYDSTGGTDGLPGQEGALLMCSFWLADNYALAGRLGEARELMDYLLSLRNDLGLLSEEYDPELGCLVGNFPQAFSHISLVNTAKNLSDQTGPSQDRAARRDGEDAAEC